MSSPLSLIIDTATNRLMNADRTTALREIRLVNGETYAVSLSFIGTVPTISALAFYVRPVIGNDNLVSVASFTGNPSAGYQFTLPATAPALATALGNADSVRLRAFLSYVVGGQTVTIAAVGVFLIDASAEPGEAPSAFVGTVNGLAGDVLITGAGNVTVTTVGNTITASGNAPDLSAYYPLTNPSGYLTSNTIPADVVRTTGAQTVNGLKSFENVCAFNSGLSALKIDAIGVGTAYGINFGNVGGTQMTDSYLISAGQTTVDYVNRTLWRDNGVFNLPVVDWGAQTLNEGAGGNATLDWSNRLLVNSATEATIDWGNRTLGGAWSIDTLPSSLDSLAHKGYVDSATGALLVTLGTYATLASLAATGAAAYPRTNPSGYLQSGVATGLYYSLTSGNANAASIVTNTANIVTNTALISSLIDATGSYYLTSNPSGYIRAIPADVVRTTGTQIISGIKIIADGSGRTSAAFDSRVLQNRVGTTVLDWQNTTLFDASLAGSMDWNARGLYDENNTAGVTWGLNSKKLTDDNAVTAVNWNTRALGGAWTAQAPTGTLGIANKAYVDSGLNATGQLVNRIKSTPFFGGGNDGTLASGFGVTGLTRDMFWSNVTLGPGDRIYTKNCKIFVSGVLDITAADASGISLNSGYLFNGGNSNGSSFGAASTSTAAAFLAAPAAGSNGRLGSTAAGLAGSAIVAGMAGGRGGAVPSAGDCGYGYATNTFTTNPVPVSGSSITIGGKQYTFVPSVGTTEGNVLISGTSAATLQNVVCAIMHNSGVLGVNYYTSGVDANVSGILSAGNLLVTALIPGSAGNAITTAVSGFGGSGFWSAATLTNGLSNLGGTSASPIATTTPAFLYRYDTAFLRGITSITAAGGGCLAGGGAGNNSLSGGGGGGAGGGGGIGAIYARTINRGAATPVACITYGGGNGGYGGTPTGVGGGGAGGGGGGGGLVYICYANLSGSVATNCIAADGGNGGNGGSGNSIIGGAYGYGASGSQGGYGGQIVLIDLTADTVTGVNNINLSGAFGFPNAGTTGGLGGLGAQTRFSL